MSALSRIAAGRSGWLLALALGCGGRTSDPGPAPSAEAQTAPAASPRPAATAEAGPEWVTNAPSGLQVLVFPEAAPAAPLVVAMHGLGDKPAAFQRMVAHEAARVNLHVPAGPLPRGSGHSWFDIRAAQDGPELAAGVAAAADTVAAYIRDVRKPGQKVVVTGFSQGGMLSFALASRHPDVVDLAVPLGGFLPTALRTGQAGNTAPPVLALHGADDTRIPTVAAEESVAWMQGAGFAATIETFAGVGHGVSPPMRARLGTAIDTVMR